jgi:uncharacterized membrane protein
MNGATIYYMTSFALVLFSGADLLRSIILLIRRGSFTPTIIAKSLAEIGWAGFVLLYFGNQLYFQRGLPNFDYALLLRFFACLSFVAHLIYVRDRVDINKKAATQSG